MGIEIDPAVFAENEDGYASESVIIIGSSDPGAAEDALLRAGRRFTHVAEDGREISSEELDTTDLYTPNYVSDIHHSPRGPWVYVDCKSFISPPMRVRMLAVLVEELERAGVSGRLEVPGESDDDYETTTSVDPTP
ncbi:hypothetical protein [Streptomyces sp. NPDC049040]|uniref:hypothetical protein n=1 Tax=Streptomyces sp. NPDC049040 TaxID=3365593 RepID=UPI0037127831